MSGRVLRERIGAWLGLDDGWTRPVQHLDRRDLLAVLAMTLAFVVNLELIRGFYHPELMQARPLEYGLIALQTTPLLWRRRLPLVSALVTFAAYAVSVHWAGEVDAQLIGLTLVFLSVFSAAAWAQNRWAMVATCAAILLADLLWITWDLAMGLSLERSFGISDNARHGLLSPTVSYAAFSYLSNLVFLGAAVLFGAGAWRRARQQAQLEAQTDQLSRQSEQLRDQAIIDERLRIARELHDVVAHHVSVTGIQAAAARRALERHPEQATRALSAVEESSREAISQMRGLLGALRGATGQEDSRQSSPTIAQISELTTDRADGLAVDYELLEQQPGQAENVPLALALSIYRTVEEALTNVRRHSSARTAQVTVRVTEDHVEAEILDQGSPVPGSSGTGLGLLGMRERVAGHRGEVEIGPRLTGGYRVRVRLPLREPAAEEQS